MLTLNWWQVDIDPSQNTVPETIDSGSPDVYYRLISKQVTCVMPLAIKFPPKED